MNLSQNEVKMTRKLQAVVLRALTLTMLSPLIPGMALAQPGAARVVEVVGDARVSFGEQISKPLTPLMSLDEGAEVRTGKDGYVKLMLADSSVVDLGAFAHLRLTAAKENDQVELGLDSGRLKAFVKHRTDGARSFRIRTKTSTMGVRGTQFVVAVFQGMNGQSNTEYYCQSGSIEVKDTARGSTALIQGGFGVSIAGHDHPKDAARDVAQTLQPQKIPPKLMNEVMDKNFLIANPPPAASDSKPPPAAAESPGHISSSDPVKPEPHRPAGNLSAGTENIEVPEKAPRGNLGISLTPESKPPETLLPRETKGPGTISFGNAGTGATADTRTPANTPGGVLPEVPTVNSPVIFKPAPLPILPTTNTDTGTKPKSNTQGAPIISEGVRAPFLPAPRTSD